VSRALIASGSNNWPFASFWTCSAKPHDALHRCKEQIIQQKHGSPRAGDDDGHKIKRGDLAFDGPFELGPERGTQFAQR